MKILLAASLAFLCLPLHSEETPLSLEKCVSLERKIQHYTDLRRKGGSANKFDEWKRQRALAEDEFRAGDCHKWRDELRKIVR